MNYAEQIKSEFDLSLLIKNKQAIEQLKIALEGFKNEFLGRVYPIGSIYISLGEASPEALFGGKWERLSDRFLMAAGDILECGREGGALSHSHSLEGGYAKLATSTSNIRFAYSETPSWTAGWTIKAAQSGEESSSAMKEGVVLGGQSQSANALPPCIGVYMWKRIQ